MVENFREIMVGKFAEKSVEMFIANIIVKFVGVFE